MSKMNDTIEGPRRTAVIRTEGNDVVAVLSCDGVEWMIWRGTDGLVKGCKRSELEAAVRQYGYEVVG